MATPVVARVEGFPLADGGRIDVTVRQGEVVRLEGANGTGKTSLLRCLAGLEAPRTPDSVSTDGAVALLMQSARDGLVGLTVAGEARLRGLPTGLLPLPPHQDVATLSSGEARRLAIAIATRSRPVLLLLDEASEGLDAEGQDRLRDAIDLARQDGAVLFVDHAGSRLAADRTIDLGVTLGPGDAVLPQVEGGDVLHAPACRLDRDHASLGLPAIHAGPGLHLVTGPNGCGKTTLLRRLAGLGHDDDVEVAGALPRSGTDVRLHLPDPRGLFLNASVMEELQEVEDEVQRLLVPDALLHRHPLTLSGGEAQRVALAKTLGRPAPVYLLDEPEAHLDGQGRQALLQVLARLLHEGKCVLVASHDPWWAGLAHSTIGWEAATP